jgi:hypothetical protein
VDAAATASEPGATISILEKQISRQSAFSVASWIVIASGAKQSRGRDISGEVTTSGLVLKRMRSVRPAPLAMTETEFGKKNAFSKRFESNPLILLRTAQGNVWKILGKYLDGKFRLFITH